MRTWFITGASRGFGALVAKEALNAGDAVVATARNPQHVIDALGDHPNLLAVALDVTNEAQAFEAAGAAVKRFGRIDVLLNNAGYGLLGAVEEAAASEVESVFRTNVFGLLNVTRAVLPHMRRQRSGHVINISSIGGYGSYPGWGVYCATKFAVEGLTEIPRHRACAARHRCHRGRTRLLPHRLPRRQIAVADRARDRGLCRDRGRDAQLRRRSQPCPARRSGEARQGSHRARQCAEEAAAPAARQRHGGDDRGQERQGRGANFAKWRCAGALHRLGTAQVA